MISWAGCGMDILIEFLKAYGTLVAAHPFAFLVVAILAGAGGFGAAKALDSSLLEANRERLLAAQEDFARVKEQREELIAQLGSHGEDTSAIRARLERVPIAAVATEAPPVGVPLKESDLLARVPPAAPRDVVLLHASPKAIVAPDSEAVGVIGVSALRAAHGTFATWVWLHRPGEGMRRVDNNRYLLACTPDPAVPYRSVISLSNGPSAKDPRRDPTWRLWLCNDEGEGHVWPYPDGGEFHVGWHLVVLRWNHDVPRLELLIDGRQVIDAKGYRRYWPGQYPERALVGCWPNFAKCHYVDTYLWRSQLLPRCVSDDWTDEELRLEKPDVVQ